MTVTLHLAVDLGAESGRVILGILDQGKLTLEEMHRFPTPSLQQQESDGSSSLRWDIAAIQHGIATGVKAATSRGRIDSIGVDTWGVDYGVLGADGELLTAPFCYRDPRTEGFPEEMAKRYGDYGFFARSGLRPMVFNTVFQLAAHVRKDPALFAKATAVIPISDVFHHWLSGVAAWERSQVGTWGLATPGAQAWDEALMKDLGLSPNLFGPITPTGTVLGPVHAHLAAEWGLNPDCRVILPGGHDTASAVGGMGADDREAAYLSSGTWSLIGCNADAANTSEAFFRADYSNEMAIDGRVRLNKNIMGLWVVQECRRAFVAEGRNASYAELAEAAATRAPAEITLDVDDPRFLTPAAVSGPMPERIAAWCREHNAPVPSDDVGFIRFALDGLAAAYARALTDLEGLAGRRFTAINIVGGGSNNRLLNELAARATGRTVIAGPGEATALGNLLVQAKSLGLVKDAAAVRAVLAKSVALQRIEPSAAKA
jgi:rhamnulokinase